MATINATPNPVVFPEFKTVIPIKMSTRITWNSFPQLGQVYLVRGGQTTRIDDGGNPQFGGFSDRPAQPIEVKDIQLGEIFEVRLTKPNDPNTLISTMPPSLVKVTTEEGVGIPRGVLDGGLIPRVQGIYDLTVNPGVDTVTMSFKTRLPTNPVVTVRFEDTGEIAGLFSKPDVRTRHEVVFDSLFPPGTGFDLKKLQNTRYTYRIVAPKTPHIFSTDPRDNAVATGFFRTGRRTATFFFDKIHVRTDGDPGLKGAGEFTFRFIAGDVITEEGLGNIEHWGEGDIDAGQDVDVNRVITIPVAPRLVGASVYGNEYDSLFPGISAVGRGPHRFPDRPGSRINDEPWGHHAVVTEYFDITEPLVGTLETPFEMSTGDFTIAYNVFGRLRVDAHAGVWIHPHKERLRPETLERRAVNAVSVGPGQGGMVGGAEGRAHQVILDPEGVVYHRALGEEPLASGNGRWTSLGGRFEGPLTVVAAGADRVSLFGLSPDGAVLHKSYAPDARPDDDWHTLGGDFIGTVVAAARADGGIELFATSGDGSVFHRSLTHPQRRQPRGEWERVGGGIGGSIAALFSPRTGLSLFALGRSGEALHKRCPPRELHKHRPSKQEEWKPAGGEWETLGVASDGLLSVEWIGDENLLLAVVAEDETVRALAWPDYPEAPPPREGWQVIGTVNSLLQGRTLEGEEPTALEGAEGVKDRPGRS